MSRYARGATFERKLIHLLLNTGNYSSILRGAGSKAYGKIKIDMVAFDNKNSIIYIMQSKKHKKENYAEEKRFYKSAKPLYKKWQVVPLFITKRNYKVMLQYIKNYPIFKSKYGMNVDGKGYK